MDIGSEHHQKIEKAKKAMKELEKVFDSAHQRRNEIKARIDDSAFKGELKVINNYDNEHLDYD